MSRRGKNNLMLICRTTAQNCSDAVERGVSHAKDEGQQQQGNKSHGVVIMRAITPVLAAAIAVSAFSEDNADIEIYTDYMIGKWSVDNSTATYLLQSTAQRNSYFNSMRVAMAPGEKLVLRYTWGAIPTEGLTHLEFYLHGAGTGNQQFNIQAVTNAWPAPSSVQLSNFASVPANGWVRVSIPLSALGAQNRWLYSLELVATGPVPTFYIDDIKLVRAPSPIPALISVNPSSTIRSVDQRMLGWSATQI